MGAKHITEQEKQIMEQVLIACMYEFYQINAGVPGPYGSPGPEWTLQKVMYDYQNLESAITGEFLNALIDALNKYPGFRSREKKEIIDIIHNTMFTRADPTPPEVLKYWIAQIAAWPEIQQIVNRQTKTKRIKAILETKLYQNKAIPHHRLADLIGRYFRNIEYQARNESANRNVSSNIFTPQQNERLVAPSAANEKEPLESDQMVNNQPHREDWPSLGEAATASPASGGGDEQIMPDLAQGNRSNSTESLSLQIYEPDEAEFPELGKPEEQAIVCNLSSTWGSFDDFGVQTESNMNQNAEADPNSRRDAPGESYPNDTTFKLFAPFPEIPNFGKDQEAIGGSIYQCDEEIRGNLDYFFANNEFNENGVANSNSFSAASNEREASSHTSESF